VTAAGPTTWTPAEIPDLTGRRALVTGATGGLGEVTARELARHGASVVLAGRSADRLDQAARRIRRAQPAADLTPLVLDLADLDSVRRAVAQTAAYGPVHLLVNNAGVMATPQRRTVDGFELQLGTNHLVHFALTGRLLPQLVAGEGRVVTVSSQMHRSVRSLPLTDPRAPDHGRYSRWRAYGRSKLANLLFMLELDRRVRRAGLPVTSVGAHPGYAATNLTWSGMQLDGRSTPGVILHAATRLVAQSAEGGAQPLLMAATLPGLPGGTYLGPSGPGEWRGTPKIVHPSRAARDERLAAGLWELSERATGVTYPHPADPS
jgi:NAD(P)-dependent dehydrogenase (short-subunit alcohol dehydrogenase family)